MGSFAIQWPSQVMVWWSSSGTSAPRCHVRLKAVASRWWTYRKNQQDDHDNVAGDDIIDKRSEMVITQSLAATVRKKGCLAKTGSGFGFETTSSIPTLGSPKRSVERKISRPYTLFDFVSNLHMRFLEIDNRKCVPRAFYVRISWMHEWMKTRLQMKFEGIQW